jgi:hypothetical protein
VRAGLREAVRPGAAAIELGDQQEQTVIRGVQVSRQLGDLQREIVVAEAAHGAGEVVVGAGKSARGAVEFVGAGGDFGAGNSAIHSRALIDLPTL